MDPVFWVFSIFILILTIGLLRNKTVTVGTENSYSIIIACRNEGKNLPALLQTLQRLDYPSDKFEILLVDDASKDNTRILLDEFCSEKENARYFCIDVKSLEYRGKKAALKLAAENARYPFLLFTDADCKVPTDWLHSYNQCISERTGMVVGTTMDPEEKGIISFANKVKFSLFAATIGLGIPFSASGGNLCIRKQSFEEVGGYERVKHFVAGDDKLMLNLISKTGWKIRYNSSHPVLTNSLETKRLRFEQKKRRFGKFFLSSPLYQIISILVLFFYIYLTYKLLFKSNWVDAGLYYFSVLIFWIANLLVHKYRFILTDLILLIIYPYYLIFFSFIGAFSKWEWKN